MNKTKLVLLIIASMNKKQSIIINSSAVREQKQMKAIGLNYFTGNIEKVVYVFHSNGNSFDTIFITVIQPKIHKSNGLLKCFCRVFLF